MVPSHRLQVGSSPGYLVGHLATCISPGKLPGRCFTCLATCSTFSMVSGCCSTWRGYMCYCVKILNLRKKIHFRQKYGGLLYAHQLKSLMKSEMNWLPRHHLGWIQRNRQRVFGASRTDIHSVVWSRIHLNTILVHLRGGHIYLRVVALDRAG